MRKVTHRTGNRLIDQANLLGETANRLLISDYDVYAKELANAATIVLQVGSKLQNKSGRVKTKDKLWPRQAA